ncbi:MAG: Uncharacterised protein [Owenweeksia sp. TMED14]|nr:MAG: Uncharacterised protein [Owenweeksia sp. TMED14]
MKLKLFKWNSLTFLGSSICTWFIPFSQSAQIFARGIISDWSIIILMHAISIFGFSKLFAKESSMIK